MNSASLFSLHPKASLLVGLLLLNVWQCALAGPYRDDEPPTLSAPVREVHDDTPIFNAFARSYKAAGRPRVALFWNRELTDQLKRKTEIVSKETERFSSTESDDTVSDSAGMHRLHEYDSLKQSVNKQTENEYDDNHRSGLNEKGDTILRTVFRDMMAAAGVHFVDRTLMLRTTAAEDDSRDTQLTETRGLINKADWLMEIVLVNDDDAPLGYGFKVSVKSLKKSMVIAEFYTQALPAPQGKQPYIATSNGFERAPARQLGVHDIGYSLGLEVMRYLSMAF